LITGVVPVWFLIALFLFLRVDYVGGWRLLGSVTIGLLPVAAGYLFRRSSANASTAPLSIPKPSTGDDDSAVSRDIAFDLPIQDWTEDRLSRAPFVRSVADLILKDKAPVIAIVGGFGEGKTSVLNLISATLVRRNDLIVVNFSSWLPGDKKTLASSLFSTIAEAAKSRYFMPGLTKELKRFARLLAGTMPKFGATLKELLEEPSQVEQLSSLKGILSQLPVRIVVLVDEADRMDKAELHLLFKAVRGVVDLPNITYVCAFDKKAITRLINNDDPFYGQIYLEKFFPVQLSLPRTDQELLGRLFDERLESICQTFELLQNEQQKKAVNESLLEIWHTSIKRYLSNFRRMALFFNALQMSLQPVSAEVNLFDMLILQLVKMISEETYHFIYENGPLFYYPRWRITLWLERLHVDDKKEAALRGERIKNYLSSLSPAMKDQLVPLLSAIFPTVDQAIRGERFSMHVQSEDAAESDRIYHPD
jgi:predicted KAP-like P-loop ATPase